MFRQVGALLAREDIVIDMVSGAAGVANLAGIARVIAPALEPVRDAAPEGWLGAWRRADAAARQAIGPGSAGGSDRGGGAVSIGTSPALARTLAAALPDGAALFLGSSQLPRDIGRFAVPRNGVRVIANRGVAGIDGTISTAVGVALARAAVGAGPTYALMGDLTFLHDITGLAIGAGEPRPEITIVVANNDGGAIFATLEQGAGEHAASFERVFGTPVGADIAWLARGFGVQHVRVQSAGELIAQLGRDPEGIRVVEVPVDRFGLRNLLDDVAESVRAGL
jgi:2-succinyl-5-enolpyruvyl-6-hydroxy-3-cyclohexene-1-carboxylate synthase